MKRLLLFAIFAALGTGVLLYVAGGLENTNKREIADGELPVSESERGRPGISTPDGQLDIESASNITQMAPPVRLVWKDRLSDETITIENFQPWRCTASEVHPLPVATTGGQGALLINVVFEVYREPKSRAEALALRDGTGEARYTALLHQRFRAGRARVTGKLGEAMAARRTGNAADRSLGDTALELSESIMLEDMGQGIVIRGGEKAILTVYPEQDHAKGKGPFALTHDAVRMTGRGLVLDRNQERDYIRVEVKKDPRLRIEKADTTANAAGSKSMLDFGGGDFEPTTVTSQGGAVLEREVLRRETVLTVMFHDQVYAAQVSGRTLEAGRATLVAYRSSTPSAAGKDWKLRRFHADRNVTIHYPGRTKKDEPYLATIDAVRLLYDVPEDGSEPSTVLEKDVEIRMRGEVAVLGPDGMLRATCSDRAWIGSLPSGAPDGGIARELLRHIALRGNAQLARAVLAADGSEDSIRADAIDLVVWPQKRESDTKTDPTNAAERASKMTAIHFAAVGDVHLDGAQVEGDTARIVADDLHTPAPRVFAEGEGTTFTFRRLGRNQGLLGPGAREDETAADGSPLVETEEDGRWMLRHVVARGAVDIDTTLGGPALGIPATLLGDEITYDGLSRIARVRALGGEPVRIGWSASSTKTNQLETRTLTLDRAAGRLTAEGGVDGELYVARGGSSSSSFAMPGTSRRGFGPSLDSAELTVSTDNRIDLTLASLEGRAKPRPGVEQWIRISGPVTTELRSSSRIVDRMRSDSLEVALAWQEPGEELDDATTVPSAKASGSANSPTPTQQERPTQALERIDVKAKSVRVDLEQGRPRYLVADGGVDLKTKDGHVTGERLTYDDERRRIAVHAGGSRPARALLGTTSQRSEVQAERMIVDVQDGRVSRLEAHAPTGRTSDIHIYRDVPKKPGAVEWFALTYQGNVVMNDARLLTQRVRLIRRVRDAGKTQYGEPVVLRAPRIVVSGTRMLSTDETLRDVATIEALESGTGPGSEVNLVYGTGVERTEMWGHRFVVQVANQRARLEGRQGRDLRIRRGGRFTMDNQAVELDLTTALPTFIPGSRIHWKPARK